MKTAAIYARVSSQRQKEEQTIASQTAALLKYAEAHGYTVPSQWIFQDEGYSGSVLVRPCLERLRDLACEGSMEAVLIYSPDRLSRKYAYQVLLMEEFARHGVEILFIHSPAATTPEEQLLVQLQGMIAEYERAQIAERTRRGKRHRAQSGLVNVLCGAPYGYQYAKKSETSTAFYEVIEEQASVVRQVYRLYTEEGRSIGAIVRWLNAQGIPTRRGNFLWERTTVWAMLRNPAYQGTACFGKTEKAERQKVTRLLRRRGGFSSRSSATKERSRKEWIAIPVPAIVSAETFALAEERLQQNKIFASRHTKVPTLLQGMLICQVCGYAYYRTSTRTSARKLYYYRCLGSDGWRYPKGQVCTNQPVRQDYLDDLVWREVMKLLEDPGLIRNEMEHRIRDLQESNPSKVRKEALAKAITRVQNGADRLLDAYQEGLLSLEQLRRRMPELKKREFALRAELQTVEASVVDRERCLRLVGNLKGFLSSLHRSAQTLDVKDRQRVLRLVVKEILVGPDTLTVKHSIPASSPSGDSEGPSYVLRGRSHHSPLRCPLTVALAQKRTSPASLYPLHYRYLKPQTNQLKHRAVGYPHPHTRQQPLMRNRIKVPFKVSVVHRLIPRAH
jgi:site-specific DNA recombinase